jgi:hypothetical protein
VTERAPLRGIELAGRFYREAVRPILDADFPGLPHAAALLGPGSEVLGFDDEVSADHHFGPRGLLFLREDDHPRVAGAIAERLRHRLPHDFLGWPTSFAEPRPDDPGTRHLSAATSGPVEHLVHVVTVRSFLRRNLGHDPHQPLTPVDWLLFPSQLLLAVTSGAVFHDDIGLEDARARLAFYPHDVWLYLMAASWSRIGEEEHLTGRAGQVGDEIGSMLIAARLVRDVMRLCFLIERAYAPYPKWYGTAFARLRTAAELIPILERVLRGPTWVERDPALGQAYAVVARLHNELGVTEPLPATPGRFWGRPFTVIHGDRFAAALRARITDPAVRGLPSGIGGIDQWSDSTEVHESAALRARLRAVHGL